MTQTSGEAILISALLNNGDVMAASHFGITNHHFIGYKSEYNWLLNYLEYYGTEPTWEAFKASFPNFPKCEHEDIRSAADLVFKAYDRIQITASMTEAMENLKMGDVAAAHGVLQGVELHRTAPKPRKLLTDMDFLDSWDEPNQAVEVPYRTLQRHTGGIRPGNIWYLAARPGQGKSAHLVNYAVRAVLDGCRVKFYSLEMNENEVRFRFHAALATVFGYKGITLTDLRDRRVDLHTYKQFVGELADRLEERGAGFLDIHTPREGVVTPGLIASGADEYHLNIVDYIGLMRADGGSRSVDDWRVAASISNDLKALAGTANTRMLVASQINREGDHGKEAPILRTLAQSDALGQDGDVVVTMRAMAHNVATLFSLEKNRHGMGGIRFCTTFDPNIGVFDEITREQADDMALMAEEL
jgi:hypothetical protein